MPKKVTLPPNLPADASGNKPGGWWHATDDSDKLVCDLCPRHCTLAPGARGFCFVRQHLDGQMVLTTYARSTGFCIDPIEKKPLNQFYPGTPILSFGTAGCNLGCKFCQNWTTSKSREVDAYCDTADPEAVAEAALRHGCRSVAFTYNDPIVWAEYAIDTAKACRRRGIKTVAVTSGYIGDEARKPFFEVIDAANVDLKGFREEFYREYCAGRLQPVLDTLRWLVHESNVWVEITNLIIPGANDSPEDLKRMCAWICGELGPDVPVHFTAFHPDFRMIDTPPTPITTLNAAYDVARAEGLQYVYTGNVADQRRQSTYCPNCGRVVIERNGYLLGTYALEGNRCRHCGTTIAGHYDEHGPGNWGGRRVPVRIRPLVRNQHPEGNPGGDAGGGDNPDHDPEGRSRASCKADKPETMPAKDETMDDQSAQRDRRRETAPQGEAASSNPGNVGPTNGPANSPSHEGAARDRPDLTEEQQQTLAQQAAAVISAAVTARQPPAVGQALGPAAKQPVLGVFVSLKRAGQLRSCCGHMGQPVALGEALLQAAWRTATSDPRFPPISPSELEHLDMEVWVLWGLEPITAKGEDRAKYVQIGRHGLQVARGAARGLLLPGVAVENEFDPLRFLEQVCLKAGLPADAWKADDTVVMTFEGYPVRARLGHLLGGQQLRVATPGPSEQQLQAMADWCRQNLVAMLLGATPSFYLPGGYDDQVCGVILRVAPAGLAEAVEAQRIVLRPELPLQATLYDLVRATAQGLQRRGVGPHVLQTAGLLVAVLWDAAMHGTLAGAETAGFQPADRALMVVEQNKWALAYNPGATTDRLLAAVREQARVRSAERASVFSFRVASTEQPVLITNVARPQPGPAVRRPVVAGRFYPGEQQKLDEALDQLLPAENSPEPWSAALVPHAGWMYSGRLAAEVLGRVKIPEQVIVVSPKHRPIGADWAVAPHETWALPGRNLASNPQLARELAEAVDGLELDAAAHAQEHAIEVQLPFLARLAPEAKVLGITMHGGDFAALQRFAKQMASVLIRQAELPLLIVSTDMNHYADLATTERADRLALDCLQALDPQRLFTTVHQQRISMCGVIAAVTVLLVLRELGRLHRAHLVGYSTSAEVTGDESRVVGYAGMLFD